MLRSPCGSGFTREEAGPAIQDDQATPSIRPAHPGYAVDGHSRDRPLPQDLRRPQMLRSPCGSGFTREEAGPAIQDDQATPSIRPAHPGYAVDRHSRARPLPQDLRRPQMLRSPCGSGFTREEAGPAIQDDQATPSIRPAHPGYAVDRHSRARPLPQDLRRPPMLRSPCGSGFTREEAGPAIQDDQATPSIRPAHPGYAVDRHSRARPLPQDLRRPQMLRSPCGSGFTREEAGPAIQDGQAAASIRPLHPGYAGNRHSRARPLPQDLHRPQVLHSPCGSGFTREEAGPAMQDGQAAASIRPLPGYAGNRHSRARPLPQDLHWAQVLRSPCGSGFTREEAGPAIQDGQAAASIRPLHPGYAGNRHSRARPLPQDLHRPQVLHSPCGSGFTREEAGPAMQDGQAAASIRPLPGYAGNRHSRARPLPQDLHWAQVLRSPCGSGFTREEAGPAIQDGQAAASIRPLHPGYAGNRRRYR